MLRALLVLILLSLACEVAKPPAYSWQTAIEEVAWSYCEAARRCDPGGFYSEEGIQRCKDRAVVDMCETDGTCQVDLGEEAAEIVAECTQVLDALEDPGSDGCFALVYFSAVPPQCSGFYDLQP